MENTMSEGTLKLVVLLASVRQGRFGPVVARWFVDEARRHGRFGVELVDLAETPLPAELPSGAEALASLAGRSPEMVRLAGVLAAADAFVVVTPEYNHGFPASIKHFIDWHLTEWRAKPVGFVSYGGVSGGLRAVEQLRQVFAELHACTTRDTVSFPDFWELFDAEGRLMDPTGPGGAAKSMLDQLAWWGEVLHRGRLRTPYAPVSR